MPIVNVYHRGPLSGMLEKDFTDLLTKTLAEKLTCEENQLTENDFSVRIFFTPHGRALKAIEVDVFAEAYPERVANRDRVSKETREILGKEFLNSSAISVSVLLCKYGYG
jgi:hypothetical protein